MAIRPATAESMAPASPRDDEQAAPGEPQPVTPHAAPIVDAAGRLTYIGSDGRRYVVADPPEDPPDDDPGETTAHPGT